MNSSFPSEFLPLDDLEEHICKITGTDGPVFIWNGDMDLPTEKELKRHKCFILRETPYVQAVVDLIIGAGIYAYYVDLSNSDVKSVTGLRARRLDISGCLHIEDFSAIHEDVRSLNLTNTMVESVKSLYNIVELNLENCQEMMGDIPPNVTDLDLSNTQVTSEQIKEIRESRPKGYELERLTLYNCHNIGDFSVLRGIKYLDVRFTGYKDKDLKFFEDSIEVVLDELPDD
jgi:hypothetical protein